eukprot:1067381-Pelagomonas_calceolata.AAC.2
MNAQIQLLSIRLASKITICQIPVFLALAQAATPSTKLLGWLQKRQDRVNLNLPLPFPTHLVCFPDLKNSLKSHMHAKHRLGYADYKTGYSTYYQSLLPHATKGISNAFWNLPGFSTRMKRTIFQYRTGTL